MEHLTNTLWHACLFSTLVLAFQQKMLGSVRIRLLRRLETTHGSRVIIRIRHQESRTFFGIPIFRHIVLDNSVHIPRTRESGPGRRADHPRQDAHGPSVQYIPIPSTGTRGNRRR